MLIVGEGEEFAYSVEIMILSRLASLVSYQVKTKVSREGHPTRYLQRYLTSWERQPQFSSNACLSLIAIYRCIVGAVLSKGHATS